MASTALQRAREEAMKGMGKYEGDFLDNDTLIANQLVFQITDVIDDRGGGFNGGDAWRLRVEPYYEGSEDPDGIVTLTDNPARRKFMGVLDSALNELLAKGEDPVIGPCVMIRLKGKNYRFNDIVDWDDENQRPILPPGAVLAGARVEEDMRPQRPRARVAPASQQPEPAPQEPQRPFAGAVEAKAEAPAAPPFPTAPETPPASKRRRAATPEPSTPSTSSTPVETAPTAEFPNLIEWARDNAGYKRGRVSNEVKERYEAAKEAWEAGQSPTSPVPPMQPARSQPYQGDAADVERELAVRAAAQAVSEPADVPVGAPHRDQVIPGHDDGLRAREIKFRPGMTGTTKEACPACGNKIHDRIFPVGDPGSGEYALVHARCDAGGEQVMMEAVPDQE